MLFKSLFIFLLVAACSVNSAKILGIFPAVGSHYILGSKLMKGLADAGHNVTLVSPTPLTSTSKNGSVRNVILEGFAEKFQKYMQHFNMFDLSKMRFYDMMSLMTKRNTILVSLTIDDPNLQQLVASGEKFDALIMEQSFNDALKIYAHIFECPTIILSSIGPNSIVNPVVGNPQPISYVPHHLVNQGKAGELSIWKRTINLLAYILAHFTNKYLIIAKQNKIIHSYYPNAPPLEELYSNVSLLLLNSHVSIVQAVPFVPNMVEVGGYFIDPPKKLPKYLQEFLDGASNGAIYFSMGSNLKSKDMSDERKRIILNVLQNLSQKVIWKFEEELVGKPANVLIQKWCPQQDVLAHPNIKLFITHGGFLSTIEAIYHGVPILAIPVFGDQPENAARAERDGYALMIEYNDPTFSQEKLEALIKEMLTNSKYTKVAKEKSKLFHDRPMKPMDAVVYWVEYVIRHRGAKHLRVAGVDLPWYKYFMVDVLGLIVAIMGVSLYVSKLVFKIVFKKICRSLGSKKVTNKQKVH